MIMRTSAKSVLIRPGVVMRSVMPCTPCSKHLVGHLERVEHRRLLVRHREQPVVRDDDERVDLFFEALDALLGLHRTAPPLEGERPGDDTDGERAEALRDLGDDRRGAGTGAAALARGDEHHVGARERLFDLDAVILGGLAPDLGIAARAEAHG